MRLKIVAIAVFTAACVSATAADAFAHMIAKGGCTPENGQAFRDEILSRGSSRDPMASYKAFRGQNPTVDALLIRRGLK